MRADNTQLIANIDQALLIAVRTCLLLTMTMPLVVTPGTLFPFVVGKALYSRSLIEIAFVLWMVLAARCPSYRPILSRLLIVFALYAGIALLAGFTGVSLQRSLWSTYERMQGVVDLLHWVAFALVLTSVFRTAADWRHALNFSLLVSVIMAFLGAATIWGWSLPYNNAQYDGQRIVITLGNAMYVGTYTLIHALIGVGLLANSFAAGRAEETEPSPPPRNPRRRRRSSSPALLKRPGIPLVWWRVFWAAAVVLNLWMMVESGTRSSFMALAAAMLAMTAGYLLWGRLKSVKIATSSVLSVIVLSGLFLVFMGETPPAQWLAQRNHLVGRLVSTNPTDDGSIGNRLSAAEAGLEGFVERPILGWGPENYIVVWGKYHDGTTVGETFDQAHSKPIEEMATRGALGLASYLALWVTMLWIVCSRLRNRGADREVLALIMGGAMVAYFIQNLALFDTPATVLMFVVMLGFAASLDTTYDGAERVSGGMPSRVTAALDPLRIRERVARAFRVHVVALAGVIFLAVALAATVYLVNIRAYQAAKTSAQAVSPLITDWPPRLYYFDRAIRLFPPLANTLRIDLFVMLGSRWDTLPEGEARALAMEMTQREAAALLESEPQQWSGYAYLAMIYQNAALTNPEYLEIARQHVATAALLAPNQPEVRELQARHRRLQDILQK